MHGSEGFNIVLNGKVKPKVRHCTSDVKSVAKTLLGIYVTAEIV